MSHLTFGSPAPEMFVSDGEHDIKTEAAYYEMEPADLHSEYMGNNDGTELDQTDFATDTIEEKLYEQRQLRIDRQSDTTRINNMSDNFFSFTITLLAMPGMYNFTTNKM